MTIGYTDIKNIAAEAAANYINKQEPLHDSLIKIAQERSLNPEQIKRAVEATNQVTYLSLLKDASDRTLEFPVADYKDVIHSIVGPEETGVEKTASVNRLADNDPMSVFSKKTEGLEKKAFDLNEVSVDGFSEQEKVSLLWNEYRRSQSELTKLAYQGEQVTQQLGDVGSKFNKDPHCLVKLSHIVDDETDYKVLVNFLDRKEEMEKMAESYDVFRDKDLDQARSLYDLYKEAKDTYQRRKDLAAKMEKAAEILSKHSSIMGKAGRGLLGAPGHILGGAAGRAAGIAAGAAVTVPYYAAKHTIGTASKAFGKGKPFGALDLLGPVGLHSHDGVWDSLHKS